MAENKGTKVIAPIVTPSTEDKFPTHISNMGKGGYHSLATLTDRDAISADRREEGMLCYVVAEGVAYQLIGGLENSNWTIFSVGGDGSDITNAGAVVYTPTGNLEATNVQSAIDELDVEKASVESVYTKEEVDTLFTDLEVDYNDLLNQPDLSSLHEHANMTTLDKITETVDGELSWDGATLGSIIAGVYDTDGDGIVDSAKTLDGLTASTEMLNHTDGLTGNIQEQIDNLSDKVDTATFFKGEFPTFADMETALPTPEAGSWVFVTADENHDDSKTQYYFDGTDWVFGGGGSGGISDPSSINISDVPYDFGNVDSKSLKEIIDELLYVAPAITAFSATPSVVEKGTAVNSLALSWTFNKDITEQSINQGIGVLEKSLRTHTITSGVTDNTSYVLTATDGKNSVNRTASISFRSKLYYGVSALTSLTNSDLLTLNGELATSKAKTVSFSPSSQYIYVAFPTSFGTAKFKVNGLDNDAWVVSAINHTNSQGFVEGYTIYRSEFLQNGSGINIEIS